MSASPAPPPPDPVRVLRYRSREHAYRAEAALDAGDTAEFEDQRHTALLERNAADDLEARRSSSGAAGGASRSPAR